MAPELPLELPALDNTMGAWLLGTFSGVLLQGVGFLQTYHYFRLSTQDTRLLKLWVSILLIVETVNTALIMHTCYYYLVTNYFNPITLIIGPVWSLKLLPVPASLAALITQTFFARRIYKINRRFRPISVAAVLLILAFFGSFVAFTALGWNKPTMSSFLEFSWLASLGSGLIMAADLMMTSVLICFLRRNHTGVARTDSILDFLVIYAVSSGLIICIFNILNVVFSLLWPDSLIYTAISIILTKLYSNTFLVSLNARQSLLAVRSGLENDTTPFRSTVLGRTHGSGVNAGVKYEHHRLSHMPELGYNVEQPGERDMELKVVTHLMVDPVDPNLESMSPGSDVTAVAL